MCSRLQQYVNIRVSNLKIPLAHVSSFSHTWTVRNSVNSVYLTPVCQIKHFFNIMGLERKKEVKRKAKEEEMGVKHSLNL